MSVDRRPRRRGGSLPAMGLTAAALLLSAGFSDSAAAQTTGVALTRDNRLLTFNPATPGTISSNVAITGLGDGEDLLGIDARPATLNTLYGLGNLGQLYVINPSSGVATPVGTPLDPDAVPLAGREYGFDFNPVPDRIRVTSDLGENLRLNPNDGTLSGTDTVLSFTGANAGEPPTLTAVAYTNNDNDAATPTTLFGIDSSLGVLVRQGGPDGNPSPNTGALTTIGSLLNSPSGDGPSFAGFDIFGPNNTALAVTSADPLFGDLARLYSVNLGTGAATLVGSVGDGSSLITGFTIVPEPTTLACVAIFGAGFLARRQRRPGGRRPA